jgi:GNAT superfamily N-acetyltransferase
MAEELGIHPASSEERIAAHTNVFDIWSKGLSLEEHIRYRLESPSHSRATWFVGCVEGRVVASLGSYPVRYRWQEKELPGIAIGSVYTLKDFRGRGYAPRLLAWVEDYERSRAAALSVLYSDIGADYYARLGYNLCPSLEGWVNPHETSLGTGSPLRLHQFSPRDHLPELKQLYSHYHGAMPLSFVRDADYWESILKKFPGDAFHALKRPTGEWVGYVRIGRKEDAWRITDFALANHSAELAELMYGAFIQLAREGGARRAGGWLPDNETTRRIFQLTPRRTEITMIKPLVGQGTLGADLIAGTSRFCEIDHV